MDTLIQSLIQTIAGQSWFGIVTAVITLASAIVACTKTPAPCSVYAKAYAVLEFIALTIGKAKDAGVPK